MKPCAGKKKPIAWLALDILDAPAAQALRAHLETCPGCRAYLAEVSAVTKQVATAAPVADLPASETFHREVMARIRAEAPAATGRAILNSWREVLFNWRVAVPATAMVVVLVMVSINHGRPTAVPPHPMVAVNLPSPVPQLADVPPPTEGSYQAVASQSLEKLDDLLAREGDRTSAPARVCTASTMALNF